MRPARPTARRRSRPASLAAIIRVTMSRVESTRPPGVRSVNTTSAAPRAVGFVERLDHVLGRHRVDDAVDLGRVDEGSGEVAGTGPRASSAQPVREEQDGRDGDRAPRGSSVLHYFSAVTGTI